MRPAVVAMLGASALVASLTGAACTRHRTLAAKEGERVLAVPGDHVEVGEVQIDVRQEEGALVLVLRDGALVSRRPAAGRRVVKLGAHEVTFEGKGPQVTLLVTTYEPPSPIGAGDAVLAADEALGYKFERVRCGDAKESPDGKTFVVRCDDESRSDSGTLVTVDAQSGAVVSMRPAGGA